MSKDFASGSAAEKLPDETSKSAQPHELSVSAIMVTNVHSVTPQMTVREAIQLLVTHKISGAPVVDQSQTVITIVSEGDLLRLAASIGLEKKIANGLDKLKTLDKIITAKKTDSFAEVYKMFLKFGVHRIVVVDANSRLLGIVSRSNVLRLLANQSD